MARVIGTAGESAAGRGLAMTILVGTLMFVLGVPMVIYLLVRSVQLGLLGLVFLAAYSLFMYKRLREASAEGLEAIREGIHYLKGAHGEALVYQELKALPDTYIIFNDFHPVGSETVARAKWNVDHIVVGPTGVFVLDAKYYRNKHVPSAARSSFSRKNVKQVQDNAMDLKSGLTRWSNGELEKLFVVPVVVYAQPDAHLEQLREGNVRTLPLRMLVREIQSHGEANIDQEKAGKIARVLYFQVGSDLQYSFKDQFDAFGELTKSARSAAKDERMRQRATGVTEAPKPQIPTVCPECGGKLVPRKANKGPRAGKAFLGCENFHTNGCRYGFNLEE